MLNLLMSTAPVLIPIENMWSIIKQYLYANGRLFTSKDIVLATIESAAEAVKPATLKI